MEGTSSIKEKIMTIAKEDSNQKNDQAADNITEEELTEVIHSYLLTK